MKTEKLIPQTADSAPDFDLIGRYCPERSRPTTDHPGGCECRQCGCVFIGAPDDGLCLVCYQEWSSQR